VGGGGGGEILCALQSLQKEIGGFVHGVLTVTVTLSM
jgi:hypothetical protein